jgi:leucyl aminopeptidase
VPKHLVNSADAAIPITPLTADGLKSWRADQPGVASAWAGANGFKANPGTSLTVPDGDGGIAAVLAGVGGDDPLAAWAALPASLPVATYRVDADLSPKEADTAALGWALGSYSFDRYRENGKIFANLLWPKTARRDHIESTAQATRLVRDLITTPASDMGPADLAKAAAGVAKAFDADFRILVGDELLEHNYPSIHAVGRAAAADRQPRLIDFTWGLADARKVTLVGKGVCFDTGGLDLKPASGMKMMKKDMGGGAHVLGLAHMIMAAQIPVRLRVLIPAVENSVSGNAMRPLDVIKTRQGLTVEIGNTDAEGRVVLSDALAEACSEKPELIVDFATLTGAARVALGTGLPALFANDDKLAADAMRLGCQTGDPVWHMPLWRPYRKLIDGAVADISNSPSVPQGGAITAALFLNEFVDSEIPWVHLDVMGWNSRSTPGRPEGGEAMGMRAMYAVIAERFGG